MVKSFLCFNCKPRAPKWGENAWEITLTTVTILLFILSIVEIIALAQYSSVFSQSEVSACCGVIEELSFGANGAVCRERDIENSHIDTFNVKGSVLCMINDEICDAFNFPDAFTIGNVTDLENGMVTIDRGTDLEECLEIGNFNLTDVCGEELINESAQHNTQATAAACIVLCLVIFSITFFGISEYIGCFEDSCWCQNKAIMVINKLLEIAIWCILLIVSQTVIENTAQNGYAARRPPSSDARTYLYNVCDIDNRAILWVDFTLNMPEWLNSPGYQAVAVIGVALSIIEFLLFFIVFHKQRTAKDDGQTTGDISPQGDTEKQMEKTIEMGTDVKNTDDKMANIVDTNDEATQLETGGNGGPTGNEDIGGSYRDSDDDVLYDDEEKEMEYVTPGGPGDTPQ